MHVSFPAGKTAISLAPVLRASVLLGLESPRHIYHENVTRYDPDCGRCDHADQTETTVLTGAAVLTAAAYLDAKFHISKDLNHLYRLKTGEMNLARAGTLSIKVVDFSDSFQ